jgi:hypothetical protein
MKSTDYVAPLAGYRLVGTGLEHPISVRNIGLYRSPPVFGTSHHSTVEARSRYGLRYSRIYLRMGIPSPPCRRRKQRPGRGGSGPVFLAVVPALTDEKAPPSRAGLGHVCHNEARMFEPLDVQNVAPWGAAVGGVGRRPLPTLSRGNDHLRNTDDRAWRPAIGKFPGNSPQSPTAHSVQFIVPQHAGTLGGDLAHRFSSSGSLKSALHCPSKRPRAPDD